MKKSYKYLVILLVGMALVLNSCKKECPCDDPTNPDCDNYDRCFGNDTINTLFKVRPGDRGFAPPEEWCDLVACDTFNASSVRFDIPDGNPLNSSYEWQIGTEAETRKGNSFEVDFSDYLRLNGWETRIPISLTVRTPMNECLRSEDEMLKTVTRELFFTNNQLALGGEFKDTLTTWEGTYDNNDEIEEFKLITVENGTYRGYQAPFTLIVGLPHKDTIMWPKNCFRQVCKNYKHTIYEVPVPENCDNKEETNYMRRIEFVLTESGQNIMARINFNQPTQNLIITFNGKRKE
jgi:hypothetical protein